MRLLPFLYDRQIGSIRKTQSYNCKPDLDFLLSRLACRQENVFTTYGGYSIPVPPFACKFRKDNESNLLAVADEDGAISMINTYSGKGVVRKFIAHNNAIFDICWLPNNNELITGSGDFRCCLFDMAVCKKLSTFQFHTASVKSIDVAPDGNLFAAGSKDGFITIWDIREDSSKPATKISQAHSRVTYNPCKKLNNKNILSSVSAVAFKDNNTLVSAGVADSAIKVWDMRKTYANSLAQQNAWYQLTFSDNKVQGLGFTSIAFNSLRTKLYASSTANKIFEMDCHAYNNNYAKYTGLKCSTYFVKIAMSHDDQYLLSGSSDCKAYVWKISKPGLPIVELPGHTAEVTSVAWGANDNTTVVTCGDDNKVFLWKTQCIDNTNKDCDKEFESKACLYSNEIPDSSFLTSDSLFIKKPVTQIKFAKEATPKQKSPPSRQNIRTFFSPLPPTPLSSKPRNKLTPPKSLILTPFVNPKTSHGTSSFSQDINVSAPCNSSEPSVSTSSTSSEYCVSTSDSGEQSFSSPKSSEPSVLTANSVKSSVSCDSSLSPSLNNSEPSVSTLDNFKSSVSTPLNNFLPSVTTHDIVELSASTCPSSESNCPAPISSESSIPTSDNGMFSISTSPITLNISTSVVHKTTASTSPVNNELSVLAPYPREPLSPRKNFPNSESFNTTHMTGKENGVEGDSRVKANGQTKRKLSPLDRCCKHHPDGCGKTRGHTRCGKRVIPVPEKHNLKYYFAVTSE